MSTPRGIHYIPLEKLAWTRQKHGTGFRYLNESGKALSAEQIERVRKLVIPPAWADVHICPDECGHVQAIGVDAKGRKQYIYHPEWMAYNQEHKFDKIVRFGEVLPTLRNTIAGHMRQRTLTHDRVLATVIWLLEHTFIRVGNKEYVKDNNSYGLTTLRDKHVEVEGNTISFSFKGKSGIYHELDIRHPRVAKTVKQCIELPGYQLFQYIDEDGQRQDVDSRDVNEYLQQITGEALSAKDFRTWGGTTLAAQTFFEMGTPETEAAYKKAVVTAVKDVSQHLRNTVAVCRKYYIHPYIYESYQKDILVPHFKKVERRTSAPAELSANEYATWTLIKEQS